jgi:hypothetical protein
MVGGPFFCLKSHSIKATVLKSYTSIDVKTGSPDPPDFATTRHLIRQLWHFTQWLCQLLSYRGRHSAICQGSLPDMPQPADFFNVTSAICQRSPKPLRELPRIANGLDAVS